MKTIYLIRHTEIYNPNKVCFGQSDMPLEENFTVQFDWIKEHLLSPEKLIFYSSPMRRCSKLCSYLSDNNLTIDNRLTDLNYGSWEMKEWADIPTEEFNAWNTDFVNYQIKNGETFLELYDRSVDFYETITSSADSEDIVVITHANVIRSVLAYILEFPLEKVYNLKVDYASITKLSYRPALGLSSVEFINLTAEQLKIKIVE